MDSFQLQALLTHAESSGKAYLEFLRVPDLSLGLYQLKTGAVDPQQPHDQDEVYFVVAGKAEIEVGEESQKVEHGSIVYVPARVPHRFLNIYEDLKVLVFFAPEESN